MCMPPFKTSAAAQTHEQVALKQKQKQTVAELESDVPLSLPLNSDDEFLKIGDQEEGLDMGNPSPRSVLKTKTSTASDDDSSSALQPLPSPTPPMADSMQIWLDPSSDSSSSSSSSDDDSYSQKSVMAWKRKPPGQGNGGKSKRAGFAASLRHLQPKTEGNHGEGIFSAGSPLSPFHCQNHLHPLSDLLEACFFCNSPFRPGKDIYMYRGDRAFCSVECRYEQIIIDERNEQCPRSSKK